MNSEIPPIVKQGGTLRYMPQLDALRAFAVGLVFLNHWGDKTGITGMLGVRPFFVISGFLITSILLGIRTEIEAKGTPWTTQLRLFYSRRFLRLFPALLLLVVDLLIFNWESITAKNVRRAFAARGARTVVINKVLQQRTQLWSTFGGGDFAQLFDSTGKATTVSIANDPAGSYNQ
jgi:peptidoglycan/LPS O-acetylase OafA/YrhL